MGASSGPQPLSVAVSQLIALRGLARLRGDAQLSDIWRETAGTRLAEQSVVLGVRRGVLHVGVASAPLLNEVASFHKASLLRQLQQNYAWLRVRDLRFKLRGDLSPD